MKLKKLAIVNHNLGSGGAEKLIYDMALELKKRGVDFTIILLTKVNCIYGKKLLEEGVDVQYLSEVWDIYSLKNIFRLIKVLKNYEIVHTHIYSAQLWTAIVSIFLPNKFYVTTEHSSNNNRRGKFIFKLLDKFMYSRYKKIISITPATELALKDWIGNYSKGVIIENGISIEEVEKAEFIPRERLNFTKDDVLICQIARLNEVKNHETSLKALKELPERYKLIFLGEGERENYLKDLTKELGVEKRVYFLGYRSDVYGILKSMDVSILTSQYEGLPISCLESMLVVPFIGSSVAGIKEVVDGYGLLFEFNNHLELKERILELTENGKKYSEIKYKCRKRAEEYDIKKTVDRYIKLYGGNL